MSRERVIRRRALLQLSALASGAIALAACTQTPPAAPTKAAPQPTKPVAPAAAPTVAPTAASQPTQPPPAPTAAPAATQPAAAAATAAPAATKPAAAPMATPEAKLGKQLIGKLEGPAIVTDPARYPKTLREPPSLAELVQAGKLPPVKERVGEDPLVIKPLREIGKYGGTWRRGFTGPGDKFNGWRTVGHDRPVYLDFTGNKIVPLAAKGWQLSDGGKTIILNLRKGMKWSDGSPFTADDFVFWFEDLYQNKDLNPSPSNYMAVNGKQATVAKIDTLAVAFRFPEQNYLFLQVLASANSLGSHAWAGQGGGGGYAPAHYLKQFHPKYVAKDELDKKVKDAKFDNWVNLIKFKNDWALNPELPVLTAWRTTKPINTPTWVLERNPYSVWVDTEGNQLPYVDKVQMNLAENLEVLNLRAIAGEYDFQDRHMDLQKVPVLLENQQKLGYRLYLDPAENGADLAMRLNLSLEKDAEVAKWLNNVDFRHALSLGIERDQLNETFWLGLGTPGSQVVSEGNLYNPGPEYRKLWSTYDPKQANELLDKIGLDKKDGEGYRVRTDGKGRLRVELMTQSGLFMQYTQAAEMIREQWKKIGIQADVVEVEPKLNNVRTKSNDYQIDIRANDGTEMLFTKPHHLFPSNPEESALSPLFSKWFVTDGKEGKEPPARMRELVDKWRKAYGVPEEEQIKLAKDIWKIACEEVWIIGTVGLSPAVVGTRVANNNLGNVPARLLNSAGAGSPGPTITEQFYFKK